MASFKGLDILGRDGDKSIIDPLDCQTRFENNLNLKQLRNGVKQIASNHAALILDMVVSGYWHTNDAGSCASVTVNPTAEWTEQGMRETWECTAPFARDRDRIVDKEFVDQLTR